MPPFQSKAQMEKFAELVKQGKMSQETFDKWMAETPHAHKLPDRVEPKEPEQDPNKWPGRERWPRRGK